MSKLKHLTCEDYVISRWSGGVTTQIAIAPEGAVYADRRFLWRISAATVEDESSVMTSLPDYNRLIAIQKGALEMTHTGCPTVLLRPYQVYRFSGGTPTVCGGTCVDYNLMLRKDICDGVMDAVLLEAGQNWPLNQWTDGTEVVVFCSEGQGVVVSPEEQIAMKAGEAVRFTGSVDVTLSAPSGGKFLICAAWQKK